MAAIMLNGKNKIDTTHLQHQPCTQTFSKKDPFRIREKDLWDVNK